MVDKISSKVFNPGQYSKEDFLKLFVVRTDKFWKIFGEIKKTPNNSSPVQHWLVVGERGMGKTTLLHRIYYEIENDRELQWLVPIRFTEEHFNITKLFKLWETLSKLLKKQGGKYERLFDEIDQSYKGFKNNDDYEEAAFKKIFDLIEADNKRVVLFIDNFGDMLDTFSKRERQRFREILMTYPRLQVVAGSSVIFQRFYLYEDPLFEHFSTERLQGLPQVEAENLFARLADFYHNQPIKKLLDTQPQKLEILRRLSGGNPRIIILLFEMLVNENIVDVLKEFTSFIDKLTPFYALKTNDLKGQRIEIVDAIALHWDAMSAGEVAEAVREKSAAISTMMIKMEEDEIIEKEFTNIKNHFYRIKDRFFNIWYLMRNSYEDEARVLWLVNFLNEWLSPEELEQKGTHFWKNYDEQDPFQKDVKAGFLKTKIPLYLADLVKNLQNEHETTSTNIPKFHSVILQKRLQNDLLSDNELKTLKEKLYESPLSLEAKLKIIDSIQNFGAEKIEKLNALLDKEAKKLEEYALAQYPQQYEQIEDETLKKQLCIGFTLIDTDNAELTMAHLRKIDTHKIQQGHKILVADLYYKVAEKMYSLGRQNREWKKKEEEKAYFLKAEQNYLAAKRFGHKEASFDLGIIYEEAFKEYKRALEYYLEAEKLNYDNKVRLFNNIGYCYYRLKKYDESIKYFNNVVGVDGKNRYALWWLGNIYASNPKTIKKAENYHLKAIEAGNNDSLNSLAWVYYTNGLKKEEAISFIERCYERNKSSETSHTYAIILLWHDKFKESLELAEKFWYDTTFLDDTEYQEFIEYLLLLCAKEQYEAVYQYFTSEQGIAAKTKDRFRPIYFALMHLMKDKFPNEYRRMGSELRETVNEILIRILEMKKKYR